MSRSDIGFVILQSPDYVSTGANQQRTREGAGGTGGATRPAVSPGIPCMLYSSTNPSTFTSQKTSPREPSTTIHAAYSLLPPRRLPCGLMLANTIGKASVSYPDLRGRHPGEHRSGRARRRASRRRQQRAGRTTVVYLTTIKNRQPRRQLVEQRPVG